MKTLKSSLLISFLLLCCMGNAQFKRINKVNTKVLMEYDVKKYKESPQLPLTREGEKVNRVICLDDSTFFFRTNLEVKEIVNGKKAYVDKSFFYRYNYVLKTMIEITDEKFKDSLNQLIAGLVVKIDKGSFDKKEAKQIAGEVSGEVGKAVLDGVFGVKVADKYEDYFQLYSPSVQSPINCKSITRAILPDDFRSTTISYLNEDRNYNSTFKIDKNENRDLVTKYSWMPFLPDIYQFVLSPNGRFVLYNCYLFDIKNKTMKILFDPQDAISSNSVFSMNKFIGLSKNCDKLIIVSTNRKNAVVDCIPFQLYYSAAMTDMTRDSIYNAMSGPSEENAFTDERDNKVYHSISIKGQTWMIENLNYGQMIKGGDKQKDNSIAEKYCYDNKEENCSIYGGLYQWDEAMAYSKEPQGICPKGWHIPSINEWETLINNNGGYKAGGPYLKEPGTEHWKPSKKALEKYGNGQGNGFNALPGGLRTKISNGFSAIGEIGFYRNSNNGQFFNFYASEELIKKQMSDPVSGFSVRCIKN